MSESQHGTRRTYQRDRCRCMPCRFAEASYRKQLRERHKAGKPIMEAKVSAVETWRRIRQLECEDLTHAEIARRLGYRHPLLQLQRDRVTLRNALKVQRLCRLVLSVPPVASPSPPVGY